MTVAPDSFFYYIMTEQDLRAYNNTPTKEKLRKERKGLVDREIRSSLLMLILKDDKL